MEPSGRRGRTDACALRRHRPPSLWSCESAGEHTSVIAQPRGAHRICIASTRLAEPDPWRCGRSTLGLACSPPVSIANLAGAGARCRRSRRDLCVARRWSTELSVCIYLVAGRQPFFWWERSSARARSSSDAILGAASRTTELRPCRAPAWVVAVPWCPRGQCLGEVRA